MDTLTCSSNTGEVEFLSCVHEPATSEWSTRAAAYLGYRRGIFVDRGCRADFAVNR